MTSLDALSFAAHDPDGLARFWAGLLGWTRDGTTLIPVDDTGFRIRIRQESAPKVVQNRMHLDLTSTSLTDQQATAARALELGASYLDVGQGPDALHVVLADPEGNELCVIEPGNRFLADCGFVGAVACDGSYEVGRFWSEALGWPLVWDEGEETAIRSPAGGPKISWGGPPLPPKPGPNRVRFELAADDAELDRLFALGATRSGELLADPDGNEFLVVRSGRSRS